jgi:hypothetical protein
MDHSEDVACSMNLAGLTSTQLNCHPNGRLLLVAMELYLDDMGDRQGLITHTDYPLDSATSSWLRITISGGRDSTCESALVDLHQAQSSGSYQLEQPSRPHGEVLLMHMILHISSSGHLQAYAGQHGLMALLLELRLRSTCS